jgi:hypothetical protein
MKKVETTISFLMEMYFIRLIWNMCSFRLGNHLERHHHKRTLGMKHHQEPIGRGKGTSG